MLKQALTKWVRMSCLSYFSITFIMNMIYWITEKEPIIIKFNHNLIIFLLCFLIFGMISIFFYKPNIKQPNSVWLIVYKTAIIYTFLSFYLRLHSLIDKSKDIFINSSQMLLIVLAISVAISLSLVKIKINKYFLKSLYYFFLLGVSFVLIFVVKANYLNADAIVAIAIYIGVFLLFDLSIYFIFVKRKATKKNEEKAYKNVFK